MKGGVLVLCLGNPDRGDDALGPSMAAVLAGRLPEGSRLVTRTGNLLSLLEDWKDADAVVCIDAALQESAGGRIERLDLSEGGLPYAKAALSAHGFGLPEALALSRTLGLAPRRIVVFAVVGEDFRRGVAMTAPVRAAMAPLAEAVLAEVDRLLILT